MKIETLKSSKDFMRLKNGRFIRSLSFLLQGIENEHIDLIRVGYTVTKQNGNAVIRNKIKRRLKAITKDVFTKYGNAKWDYVIIGKKKTLVTSFEELKKELENTIKKIHKET